MDSNRVIRRPGRCRTPRLVTHSWSSHVQLPAFEHSTLLDRALADRAQGPPVLRAAPALEWRMPSSMSWRPLSRLPSTSQYSPRARPRSSSRSALRPAGDWRRALLRQNVDVGAKRSLSRMDAHGPGHPALSLNYRDLRDEGIGRGRRSEDQGPGTDRGHRGPRRIRKFYRWSHFLLLVFDQGFQPRSRRILSSPKLG